VISLAKIAPWLLLLAVPAFAQQVHGYGAFTVSVIDSVSGDPVYANITLDSMDLGFVYSTATVEFDSLPSGNHALRVNAIDYIPYERLINITPKDTQHLVILMLDYEHGYGELARRDIARGLVRILLPGLQVGEIPDSTFTDKYGFRYDPHCTFTGFEDKYNEVVEDYLNKRNGPGWQASLRAEFSEPLRSLRKVLKDK
jgi:hypothetical protein